MYLIEAVTKIDQSNDYLLEYFIEGDNFNYKELVCSRKKLTNICHSLGFSITDILNRKKSHADIIIAINRSDTKIPIISKIKNLFKPFEIALMIIAFIILSHKLDAQITNQWVVNDNCEALALHIESVYEIPTELTVAIYRHESAHGTSNVAKTKNNYFGIRQMIVFDSDTTFEYKKFDSKLHCFLYFGNMLREGNIYPECLDQSPGNIARCMHSKNYSLDPNWSNAIIKLINQGI